MAGTKSIHSTESRILERIAAEEYTAFTAKDFLDLASYEAAKKALQRLANTGKIRRILRGVYEFPSYSPVRKGPASPNPDAIARAIARAYGWTLIPTGETALNVLGLSTQVPAQWQYLSDGPTKSYDWDGGSIHLKHRANKEMAGLSPTTALVVQALKTLGESRVNEQTLVTLRAKLSRPDREQALREARYTTTWIFEAIKRLAPKESARHA
ncbi:hypothetical protein GC163_24365 [bacterium]|nr:hypothetical protein [bacterium]